MLRRTPVLPWPWGSTPSRSSACEGSCAARELQALADRLRHLGDSPLLRELHALCGWLDESDNITDFSLRAHEFRIRIGIDRHVETADDYLRILIELAKEAA